MGPHTDVRPRRLHVDDMMTSPAVTVAETTPVKEVAETLARLHVGGLPVVDLDGRVVGVVSEGDLILIEGSHDGAMARWWQPKARAEEGRKAHATIAGELMTAPAVTVAPGIRLAAAARLMASHAVNRLPVVDPDGRPLGIVSRSDLVKALCRPDEDIRRDVVEGVIAGWMSLDAAPLDIEVANGVVLIGGELERRSEVDMVERLIEGLDSVVAVQSVLTYRVDDLHIRPPGDTKVY